MPLHARVFPMEIATGVTKSGLSIREWLGWKEAGLDPGTAAEILDDEVRWVLTKASCRRFVIGNGDRPRGGSAVEAAHENVGTKTRCA